MSDVKRTTRVIHEFPYRPSVFTLAILLGLACGGMAICTYFALFADRGARSARGIELTRDQFRLATGAVALLSPVGIAALAMHLRNACRSRRRVALTASSMIVPEDGLSHTSTAEVEVPLEDIDSSRIEHLLENDFVLVVAHRGGTTKLLSERFARRRDFDTFAALVEAALAERVPHVGIAEHHQRPNSERHA